MDCSEPLVQSLPPTSPPAIPPYHLAPMPSYKAVTYLIVSHSLHCSAPTCPVPYHPILSHPTLHCPIHSYPTGSCPMPFPTCCSLSFLCLVLGLTILTYSLPFCTILTILVLAFFVWFFVSFLLFNNSQGENLAPFPNARMMGAQKKSRSSEAVGLLLLETFLSD